MVAPTAAGSSGVPASRASFGAAGSQTVGSVASTSSMRCAATSARGSMMEIMPIMRKLMMMTMEYVMNAMRSPVWMTPVSM